MTTPSKEEAVLQLATQLERYAARTSLHTDIAADFRQAAEIVRATATLPPQHSSGDAREIERIIRQHVFTVRGRKETLFDEDGLKRAVREIAALGSQDRPAPDGWVLVPPELTQAMVNAFFVAYQNDGLLRDAYRAMLAASPSRAEGDAAMSKGASFGPGSREPSPDSLGPSGFDPARNQYCYVGPVLLVLTTMPSEATLVRHASNGRPVEPTEVWINVLKTWVRLNGEWISGWDEGDHFAFRPNWLNRWKLRRAGRRWLRDRDGAEGRDANAAPVPKDRQARAEGIAQNPEQGQ